MTLTVAILLASSFGLLFLATLKVQVSVSAENILVGRAQNDRRDDESLDTESREKFRRKIGKRAADAHGEGTALHTSCTRV